MRRARPLFAAVLGLALAGPPPAGALLVGGGGNPATDCLLVFDGPVNVPAPNPRNVRCADGAACDGDGEVNGSCLFPVAVCANSTFDARCTEVGVQAITVDHALDNGDPKFDPQFQALQTRIDSAIEPPTAALDSCTTPTNFVVPVRGPFAGGVCRRGRKAVRVITLSNGFVRDVDRIKLTCDPAPAGCDPLAFFDGTFDRIQRQVFNQSCAVSGCHDSQTMQADLLLETGSAYGNLVGVTPTNGNAAAAGWLRVMPGDSDTSYLHHKVTGDLPAGFGARMPFGQPPLAPNLVDIIRLWIEAGAPATGWVPGTDQ